MAAFQIYHEPADTNEPRKPLGVQEADTMAEALDLASQYYEIPAHDLVAVQIVPEKKADTLTVPVIRVNQPCEECGSTHYPNLKYSLVGITGVLCQHCLEQVIAQINSALEATKGRQNPFEDKE